MSAPRPYASGTTVSVEKTKAEIDLLLTKHGATQHGVVADVGAGRAMIAFIISERHYRLDVPLPRLEEFGDPKKHAWEQKKCSLPMRWDNWDVDRRVQWLRSEADQRSRERWRAVLLMIKAKLELVRIGISTVEKEFLSDLVVNGRTVSQIIESQIENVLAGHTPRLLPEAT